MTRGTTPTFIFTLPETVDLTEAANVYVTFEQRDKTITKTGEDLTVAAHQVDVYLDQTESLSFVGGILMAQLNWTFAGGQRACSNIVSISVGDNLAPEVLE